MYQYDKNILSYRTLPVKTKLGQENHYSISTNFVRSKNGAVWFGTYGALIGYNGLDFKIINDGSLGLNDETGHLHIRSIMEDSKGNLWIGNNGIGVLKYEGKKVINFTDQQKLKKEDTKGNSLERVFSIGEDASGNIWFGTAESGVWRYDGTSVKNLPKKMVSMVTLFGLYTKAKQENFGLAVVPMVCIVSMVSLLTENINKKYERTTGGLAIWRGDEYIPSFLFATQLLSQLNE